MILLSEVRPTTRWFERPRTYTRYFPSGGSRTLYDRHVIYRMAREEGKAVMIVGFLHVESDGRITMVAEDGATTSERPPVLDFEAYASLLDHLPYASLTVDLSDLGRF